MWSPRLRAGKVRRASCRVRAPEVPRAARTVPRPRSGRRGPRIWWHFHIGCARGRRRAPAPGAGAQSPSRSRSSRRPPGCGRWRPDFRRQLYGVRPQARRARWLARRRARRHRPSLGTIADDGGDEPRRAVSQRTRGHRRVARRGQVGPVRWHPPDERRYALSWLGVELPAPARRHRGRLGEAHRHGTRFIGQIEQARIVKPIGAADGDRLGDVRPAHSREEVWGQRGRQARGTSPRVSRVSLPPSAGRGHQHDGLRWPVMAARCPGRKAVATARQACLPGCTDHLPVPLTHVAPLPRCAQAKASTALPPNRPALSRFIKR